MDESNQMSPTRDPTSGCTLPRYDPWRKALHARHQRKRLPQADQLLPATPAPRKRTLPKLPANDYTIIIRPRGGLRVDAWTARQLAPSIQQASNIPIQVFCSEVITLPQPAQNLITLSTPNEACADALRKLTNIHLGTTDYEITTYLIKHPPGTCRGVIQGIDPGPSPEQLLTLITTTGHQILEARMIRMSDTVTITFDDPHVPFYVRVYGTLVRCKHYRNTYQCCVGCGELGHRSDLCPSPRQASAPSATHRILLPTALAAPSASSAD
ncbi:hypothetical protein HPB48_002919 [Haemaphysalis longicornis]|uniref:CCHC-type domain-containing protein n=1 Tax=Haemaphysalis longicornis TaxID=44386 RepID=A0A9J6FFA6_HAELO|nr:hypothetical protein HPB48_002919 [Haemaphysalis longicornis]